MQKRVLFYAAVFSAVGALAGATAGIGVWEAIDDDAGRIAAPTSTSDTSQPVANAPLDVSELVQRTSDGVVQVRVDGGFGGGASGSGFVIDELGHVVTNEHVVGSATTVTVVLANGDERSARVVGTDPSTDIALLELADIEGLEPVPLGSSSDLEVGDPVVAIGSPFGLSGTVTSGIVSGLDREIRAPNGFAIDGVIQTDAALNSGNSGGPLLDLQGRVVGVNSQIESTSGGNVGVGFAVPVETAKSVVEQLLEDGVVEHAYLGVQLGDESDRGGARIVRVVSGTPADRAGLRQGDVVVRAAGEQVQGGADLRRIVSSRQPGDRIVLEVKRDGQPERVEVELGDRPEGTQ